MKRISLLALLLLAAAVSALAATEVSVPLRVGVIHIADASSLPGSCTVGTSPSVITDDDMEYYACVGGVYTFVVPIFVDYFGLQPIAGTDPVLTFFPTAGTGGGFRFYSGGSAYFGCTQASSGGVAGFVTCDAAGVGTARWKFTASSTIPFTVVGDVAASSFNHVAITDPGGTATLTMTVGKTLSVTNTATVNGGTHSGTNTGDETASRVRALGFFDTTNDGTGSGLDCDLLDGFHSSSFQPLDSDLSSIAALATTAYGRGHLDDADAAEARTTIGALYALPINAWGGVSGLIPFDATTYFMGGTGPILTTTTNAVRKIYFRKAGIVRVAELSLYCTGTAGSNENVSAYFRLNDTTDSLIATVGTSAAERNFTNTAINVSVASGDFFEIKVVAPTWATNPTVCYFSGYVLVE